MTCITDDHLSLIFVHFFITSESAISPLVMTPLVTILLLDKPHLVPQGQLFPPYCCLTILLLNKPHLVPLGELFPPHYCLTILLLKKPHLVPQGQLFPPHCCLTILLLNKPHLVPQGQPFPPHYCLTILYTTFTQQTSSCAPRSTFSSSLLSRTGPRHCKMRPRHSVRFCCNTRLVEGE